MDIERVEQVEGFRHSFQVGLFGNYKCARDAHVYCLIAVALKSVSRFDSNPIVVSKNVAVLIETGKLRKVVRRLQTYDRRQLPIVDDRIQVGRTR